MATTYEPIATTTLASNNTVTFSSIPATYDDLVLVVSGGIANNYWGLVCRFNSDTGSNYSDTFFYGDGSSAASSRSSNATYMAIGGNGFGYLDINSITIANFMNYSNTTTYKTVISRGNLAGTGTGASVGLWRNTSAINSITLYSSASSGGTTNLYAGTTLTLYGIKAA